MGDYDIILSTLAFMQLCHFPRDRWDGIKLARTRGNQRVGEWSSKNVTETIFRRQIYIIYVTLREMVWNVRP